MPGYGRDFDIFHNAAQIVPRDTDQTIVIRVSDPASVLLRLEQDRQNLPDLLRKIALLAVVGHTLRRVRARGFYGAFVPGRREYGNPCTAATPTCSRNATACA